MKTDSLDTVITRILSQKGPDREWHSITYFSKTINSAECNYKIHNKELLAIITGLKEWRAELEGIPNQFLILTDHRALEFFGTKQLLNTRQTR